MYLVISIVENTKGEKTQTIDAKPTEKSARVHYHGKLQAYNNASDVKTATVLIMTESGIVLPMFRETVSNVSNATE